MNRSLRTLVAAGLALAAGLTQLVGASHAAPPGFSATVNNPWFPLVPGTTYHYTGVKDGKHSRDLLHVTNRTKTIDGAPCVVVRDRLYLDGKLAERTTDYYTQDAKGNVWYFGETTAELDAHGHVTSRAGTWMAGQNGAKPGIYLPANPHAGESGRQEYYKGQAEDHYAVIRLFHTVTGPGGRTVLLTKEWTPLEPGVLDHKMYAYGVGTVLEQTERGGDERNELVGVTRGAVIAAPTRWGNPVELPCVTVIERLLGSLARPHASVTTTENS